jgi:CheY-like chemotaxis protein
VAKILILEDDYDAAQGWRRALREAGHDVTLSYTSSEAVAHCEYEKFGVYIVDMRIDIEVENLRDSGIKLLGYLGKTLKRNEISKRVVGVSGLMIDQTDTLARQSFHLFEVEQFLPKPFEPKELVAQVGRMLESLGES